jgi:hypothetical protein
MSDKPEDPKALPPAAKASGRDPSIQDQLKAIADALRTNRRKDPVKQSLLSKGFDVTKEVKKRNKSYKYRYPTRLQQINDARAEAARSKRLSNPELKAINDETIKLAQEKVEQQRKDRFKQMEWERFRSRTSNSFHAFKGNPYSLHPEETIEVVPNQHQNPPKFKNKIEEEIYRLTKKK